MGLFESFRFEELEGDSFHYSKAPHAGRERFEILLFAAKLFFGEASNILVFTAGTKRSNSFQRGCDNAGVKAFVHEMSLCFDYRATTLHILA